MAMSSAVLKGNQQALKVPHGITALPIGSIAFATGLTNPTPTTFQIANTGNYSLNVRLLCAGVMGDVPFKLELYNQTTGAVEDEVTLTAPNLGYYATVEATFVWNVANAAHSFQIRINAFDRMVGEPTNAINLQSPQFTALAQVFGTTGIVGPGTVNTVAKFTAADAVGDSNITDDGTVVTVNSATIINGNTNINGDVTVSGTIVAVDTEHLLIQDNYIYQNNGYTTVAAKTGGSVINYLPTATNDTVAAGGFTAGVAAVSNPTVATTGAATFALGDLIQVSGADDAQNNGLFEVLSHAANLLTIRGVGTVAVVEDFTQNQFATDATVAGTITKVNVAVMRAGATGDWEVGKGSATALTFTGVVTGTGTLNRIPKFTSPSTLGNSNLRETATGLSNPTAGVRSETFGNDALPISSTAQETTAFGYQAGKNSPAGNERSSFFGCQAGVNANTAFGTTAIGYLAGENVTGCAFTGVGGYAGAGAGPGNSNNFFGWGAGLNCTGTENVAIGDAALEGAGAINANYNVVIGSYGAIGNFQAIQYSVIIGNDAMLNGNSDSSVYIGAGVAPNVTNDNNVVIGRSAGSAMTSSGNNVVAGSGAAPTLSTGDQNVIIGRLANVTAGTVSNTVAIGDGATAGSNAVGIGEGVSAAGNSICLGTAAISTANQFVAGSLTYPINNVYFGQGSVSTAPTAWTLRGTDSTGAGNAGGSIHVQPGDGAGAGDGGNFEVLLGQHGGTGQDGVAYINRTGILSSSIDPALLTLSDNDTLVLSDENNGGMNIRLVNASNFATAPTRFVSMFTRGTLNVPATAVNGDDTLLIASGIYDGNTAQYTAAINIECDNVVAPGNAPQAMHFQTGAGNSASRTDRYIIGSSGANTWIAPAATNQAFKFNCHGSDNVDAALLATNDRFYIADQTTLAFKLMVASNVPTDQSVIRMIKTRGSYGALVAVQNGDEISSIVSQAYDGVGIVASTSFSTYVDGAVGAGVVPMAFSIRTSPTGAAGRVDRYVIRADGTHEWGVEEFKGKPGTLPTAFNDGANDGQTFYYRCEDGGGANSDGGNIFFRIGDATGTGIRGGFHITASDDTRATLFSSGFLYPTSLLSTAVEQPNGNTLSVVCASGSPRIVGTAANGTFAVPTTLNNNNIVFQVISSGFDGGIFNTTALMQFEVDGVPVASTSLPQRIVFETGPTNVASRTKRYTIGSSGTHEWGVAEFKGKPGTLPTAFNDGANDGQTFYYRCEDGGGANSDGGNLFFRTGDATGTGMDGGVVVSESDTPRSTLATNGWVSSPSYFTVASDHARGNNLSLLSASGTSRVVGSCSRGTLAVPTTLISGDQIFRLTASAYDGSNFQTVGSINFEVDGLVSGGVVPQRIVFETGATNTASRVERMRITSGGDLYLGNGETNGSPANALFSGTNGSGSNISGADLTIRGGLSTGTGVGGSVIFNASDWGAAPAGTLNSSEWVAEVVSNTNKISSLGNGDYCIGLLKRYSVQVLDNSASGTYSIQPEDSGRVFTNKNASNIVIFTLPAAEPGLCYDFVVKTAQILQIKCTGSDLIQFAAATTTGAGAGGNINSNTVGNVLRIMGIAAPGGTPPQWFVMSAVGTWTVV